MDKKEFKQKIKKEFADIFMIKYKDYNITKKTEYWRENNTDFEGIYLVIKNPHGEDIEIMYDGNHVPDEMILSCSRCHNHFSHFYEMLDGIEKEENLADYVGYYVKRLGKIIDGILQGKEIEEAFDG